MAKAKQRIEKVGSLPPNRGKGWHFVSWGNRKDIDRGYRSAFPSPRYKLLVLPAFPSSGWKFGLWMFDTEAKPRRKRRSPSRF